MNTISYLFHLVRRRRLLTFAFAVLLLLLTVLSGRFFHTVPAYATIGSNDYPYKNVGSGTDPWGFAYRNCTSFVAWRLNNDLGIPFNSQYKGVTWGDAYTWANAAKAVGFTVDSYPKRGSLAVWSASLSGSNGHGHVAFVLQVNGDGTITVEDYNWIPLSYDLHTVSASGVQFIHFTDRKHVRSFGKVDFNGDGISDFVIYSGGQWAVRSGASPYSYLVQGLQFGGPNDIPLVADFNGDGISDFVIYSGGQWAVRSGVYPYSYLAQGIGLGGSSDIPLLGDFNHDGVSDFVVDSGGQWAVRSGVYPYSYLAQGIGLGGPSDIAL